MSSCLTDCKSKLSGVVNFVTGHLRPIRSDMDETLSSWYKANSRVYVAKDHSCWLDPKLEAKIRKKRFGLVIRSPEPGLNGMMRQHAAEVEDFISSRCVLSGDETTEDDAMAT